MNDGCVEVHIIATGVCANEFTSVRPKSSYFFENFNYSYNNFVSTMMSNRKLSLLFVSYCQFICLVIAFGVHRVTSTRSCCERDVTLMISLLGCHGNTDR